MKCRVNMAIGFLILILSLGLLPACSFAPKAGIIVAGSTSVQPYAEILAEEFMKSHPGVTVDVQGGGSSSGITAAQTGTADIGMSSRELKGEEKNLWSAEIAKDGLAVIVHPSNPVSNFTLSQVRDIYSVAISEWNGPGSVKSKIHVITREEGSGTRSAFESLVMGKMEITPKAIVQDSNGAVRQLVADDPSAIGFISLGLINEKVKALELDGIAASHNNVINGSYGLSRPFILICKAQPDGQTKQFIDFVLSEEGQRLLTAEGLVTKMEGKPK